MRMPKFGKEDIDRLHFMSEGELKDYIRSAGKRAQARMKTLATAYGEGGTLYGRRSYVLDKYGDFNVKTKGLSKKALKMKAIKAAEILNAKSSTVAGVKDIDRRRYETFKRRRGDYFDRPAPAPSPGAASTGADPHATYQSQAGLDESTWEQAMQNVGKIQAAEGTTRYDSWEQLYMAVSAARSGTSIDDLLDTFDSEMYFSQADVEDTLAFMESSAPQEWTEVTEGTDLPFD